jgi:hypothetical protein
VKGRNHQIRTHSLELLLDNESRASQLQQLVIDLCQHELQPMMEACFDASCAPDKIIRFKRVEIDIGIIDMDELRSQWPQRVTNALCLALADALRNPSANGVEITLMRSGQLDCLAYYFRFGYLPWSVQQTDVATLLQNTLKQEPDALAGLMRTLGSSLSVRTRIVERFNSDRLRQLVTVLEPRNANDLIAYHNYLVKLNQQEDIVKAQQNVLEKTVWLFVFNYLLVERDSVFNTKSYAKSILQQFAFHFNIAFDDLVLLIVATLPKWKDIIPLPFAVIIAEIYNDLPIINNSALLNKAFSKAKIKMPDSLSHVVEMMSSESEVKEETFVRFINEIKRHRDKTAIIYYLLIKSHERMASNIVQYLLPEQADKIGVYHACLVAVHRADPLANISEREVINTAWSLIISLLLDTRGSYFNQKNFLKALIYTTASHYNLSERILLERLLEAQHGLKALPLAISGFLQFIQEIYNELTGALYFSALPKKNSKENQSILQQIEKAWKQLQDNSGHQDTQLAAWIHQSLQAKPVQFTKMVKRQLGKVYVRKQLASISQDDFRHILALVVKSPTAEMMRDVILFLETIADKMLPFFGSEANYHLAVNATMLEVAHSLNGTLRKSALLQLILEKLTSQHSALVVNELVALHGQYSKKPTREGNVSSADKKTFQKKQLQEPGQVIENYIQSVIQGHALNQLHDYGFESGDDAIQFFNTHHPDQLYRVCGKASLQQLEIFVVSLSNNTLTALWNANKRIQHTDHYLWWKEWGKILVGFSRAEEVLQEIRKVFLIAAMSSTPITHQRTLRSLLEVVRHYRVPNVFLERLVHWSLPASGDPTESIRFIEQKVLKLAGRSGKEDANKIRMKILTESAEQVRRIASQTQEPSSDREAEPVFISNAGLVLVHPYLQFLFDQCHLLDKRDFKDERSRARAVVLMHYAVTGSVDYREEDCLLYKLLCGFPMYAVTAAVKLKSIEKKLVNEMLFVLTTHWPVIRNSTPDEVRGNWLVRDGRLLEHEDFWELKVERKPYDILLESLPFTLSPVKFSWMSKRLSINW